MKSVNKIMLLGNVGRPPETRKTATGTSMTTTSLATNRRVKDRDGQTSETTEWHRIVFIGALADLAAECVKKGDPIYVEGRVEYSETDGDDGVRRRWTSVVVKELVLLW